MISKAVPVLIAAILFIFCAAVCRAEMGSVTLGGLEVTVWSGPDKPGERRPVIIYSHGFHGCSAESRYLFEAAARAGYIIFAPNHRDAICGSHPAQVDEWPIASFRHPEVWSETTYADRGTDIRTLIEAIKQDSRYAARVDWKHFGLAGHSLGGYTVLSLAGAWPSRKLDGINAVLALSPYTRPFDVQKTWQHVSTPIMFQGGTDDLGLIPEPHKSLTSYHLAAPPKYYVEFKGATHTAWINTKIYSRAQRDAIVAYSLAFLDHYVRGIPANKTLTSPQREVAMLDYDSELGTAEDTLSASENAPP